MNLLFESEKSEIPQIGGLTYIPNFITKDQEDDLLRSLDKQEWLNDLKRRVQHYGYKYDYKSRSINKESYLGKLPKWLSPIQEQLIKQSIFQAKPDQAIINEYEPGQGISPHVDCIPCFGNVIASLSLISGATMQFINFNTKEKQGIYLKPRSLIVLSDAARYNQQHSIPARKSDRVDGNKLIRKRRVSITFRNIILND